MRVRVDHLGRPKAKLAEAGVVCRMMDSGFLSDQISNRQNCIERCCGNGGGTER